MVRIAKLAKSNGSELVVSRTSLNAKKAERLINGILRINRSGYACIAIPYHRSLVANSAEKLSFNVCNG